MAARAKKTQDLPPFLRQVLGNKFRRRREALKLSREQVGQKLDIADYTVMRHETGDTLITVPLVRAYCDVYEITDDQERTELIELAKMGKQRGWWTTYGGSLQPSYSYVVEAEQMSRFGSGIRTWEPLIVPGLFQTDEYTGALFERSQLIWKEDNPLPLDQAVESRAKRKLLLDGDNPPQIWAILGEGAIRTPIGGPDVMDRQIRHLLDLCERPNITIQIVPYDTGYNPGTDGPFVLYSFSKAADDGVVYYEVSRSFSDDVATLARHTRQFDLLRAQGTHLAQAQRYLHDALSS
ncbi:helix-turn-helix domain-containing protein [Kitasatospora sp. NPDC085464]|uniref:helix-turn-helix domain-containing protein n=1 Tax=Kitasatospora sp. NPDC085464 TaxID=3364063 RepID=UPI0037CBAD27